MKRLAVLATLTLIGCSDTQDSVPTTDGGTDLAQDLGQDMARDLGSDDSKPSDLGLKDMSDQGASDQGRPDIGADIGDDMSGEVGFESCPSPMPQGWLMCDDFEEGGLSARGTGIWQSNGPGVSVSATQAFAGQSSLALAFAATADGGDGNAEQRFSLSQPEPELWIQYALYVPNNYTHRDQDALNESANNKAFIHLWSGDYSGGPGAAAGFEFWPRSGESVTTFHPFRPDIGHIETATGRGVGIAMSDRGQWGQITIHVKAATAANNDGVAEVWRRDSAGNVALIYQQTALAMYAEPSAFENGYLFGWSNSGFQDATTLRVDNFVVSTEALTP